MAHIHEKYDFTVGCFIVFEGKVLLVNHPRYDMWLCPGGHIELDEDPEEALFREIQEETGLEVEIMSIKPDLNFPGTKYIYMPAYISVHEANLPHRHIGLTYFGKAKSAKNLKSDEHSEARWLAADELDNPDMNIPPEIRHFGKQAIEESKNW